jgi:viroplasmin and RNaseH domain-containing protein
LIVTIDNKLLNCNFFQNEWNENWNDFENFHYLSANFGTHIKDIENCQFTMALKIYIKLLICNVCQNKWNENSNGFEDLQYLIVNFGTPMKAKKMAI